MRPSATSACGLRVLALVALVALVAQQARVVVLVGLKLLVYEALSY